MLRLFSLDKVYMAITMILFKIKQSVAKGMKMEKINRGDLLPFERENSVII